MLPDRDHSLPPDLGAYRTAMHPRGRIMVISPTRAACETIELALHTQVETLIEREHGATVRQWARDGKAFGIVAGTGTGKTLAVRMIAEEILAEPLRIGVVNREREATEETPSWNVVIVTTGIARRWLADDLIGRGDTVVVDEIHQTSAELELCLALGKRAGCRFIWLSATVDPTIYRRYLDSDDVLETSAFDPSRKASVSVMAKRPEEFLDARTIRRFIAEKRGVAVFLPTRAEVEQLGQRLAEQHPRLATAYYHGGEPIRVLRPFLEGTVRKPFVLAMTAAGQSALNLPGLDTVVIYDARYGNLVERGRNVLHRLYLGPNEILQMAGRVHGRVAGGEVVILSDRDLAFDTLRPGPPEFQLAGDAERVALTCAAIGVDATDLDLPAPLDRVAYRRAVVRLTRRGLIEGTRLTRYGRQVEALPVERPWAELLLHAGQDELPLVAGASGIDSLHRMTRDERDLSGALVVGSDHLTVYNLLAEAVNRASTIGEVHGLRRHVFDEAKLAPLAERRGVLVKALEDGALGLAAVYRALDLELPGELPFADESRAARFVDLVARIAPFDLVLNDQTADGQEVRISRTSVAGNWGAVAGSLRYFADRSGGVRASVEGTTIPFDALQRYAVREPGALVIGWHKQQQGFALTRRVTYFDFELERSTDRIRGELPADLRDAGVELLAGGLIAGTVTHPSRARLDGAVARLDEYWRRSGGTLAGIDPASIALLIRAQLADVTSWPQFERTPVQLDVSALVRQDDRAHLDALPASIRLCGDALPLHYEVRDGAALARVTLREGQVRRLRVGDLPALDRPLVFAMRSRGQVLQSDSVDGLRELLRTHENRREHPAAGHHGGGGGRGGEGKRGGRDKGGRGSAGRPPSHRRKRH
jgi:ATP-dependent helicase HrpA